MTQEVNEQVMIGTIGALYAVCNRLIIKGVLTTGEIQEELRLSLETMPQGLRGQPLTLPIRALQKWLRTAEQGGGSAPPGSDGAGGRQGRPRPPWFRGIQPEAPD